ncbi:helix-turn-helix domain-containing protein [Streptomyces rubellomurinus]|uniref:DNA-binding protein n=1 Tax=Streptomyces rubellomurinus (strain ATCC 31215) TaxID=359131 RepID=A0A0F2TFL6_STRR3|nr:helix-turn-helix transcriptional regulator [Streptomyces rubellomurinus]KJS60507.1 DNA-binding protein [Streptomyces rubellomurinus]
MAADGVTGTVFEDGEKEVLSDGVAELYSAVGKLIKFFRERAGYTQKQVAKLTGYSEDQIGSMERGVRTARVEYLTVVDDLFNAQGALKVVADDVMRAKVRMSERHPAFNRAFTSEEAKALEIHEYSTMVIPGLLQTEAYIRALYEMRRPLLSPEQIDKWLAARLARQEILNRWPLPVVTWVLDESVLRRPLGGWDVHADQLRHLLDVGQMRGPELQVMPLDRMSHAGMGGSFTLLTPPNRPQVCYAAAQHVNRLITDPVEVRNMAARYSSIRAQALSLAESLALIEKILGER